MRIRDISVIAKNTFRETIRDKILYALVGFSALFIISDLFIAKLSLGDVVAVKSFGLGGIYLFGMIATIFLGASLIYKEIEQRTLYFVLSKPVSRLDVLLGKFAGLFLAVLLTTALMLLVYLGTIFYEAGTIDWYGILAVCFQVMEEAFFVSLLIFFSSVAAPLTSTLCAVMVLFIGHLLNAAMDEAKFIGGLTYRAVEVAYYLLPNLEKFNMRNLAVHGSAITLTSAAAALAYAILYSFLLFFLAYTFFERREL